jgi:hypothetical protein
MCSCNPALSQTVSGTAVADDAATGVGFSVDSIAPVWKRFMDQWNHLKIDRVIPCRHLPLIGVPAVYDFEPSHGTATVVDPVI